jgi:opacity protein-like surface antigen
VNIIGISLSIIVVSAGLAMAQSTNITATPSGSTSAAKSSDPKEITPVLAEKPVSASPFQFDIGLPTWASGISGVTGVKGVQGNVSQSFSSIWHHLDYVIPLTMDLRYQKWGFHVDGQIVQLSQTFDTRGVLYLSNNLRMQQAFANFDLDYRVLDTDRWQVDPYIGGRYNYFSLAGDLQSRFPRIIPNFDETGSTSWVDPILGINAKVHVYKPFSLLMLGDVGGFGVGSHITYQFYGAGELQLTRNMFMDLGYRYLDTDYSSGGFTYDVDMKGPQITMGANF